MATVDISEALSNSPFESTSPQEQSIRRTSEAEDELDFEEGEEESEDHQIQSNKTSVKEGEPGDEQVKPHGRDDGEEGQVDTDEDLEEGELKEDDDEEGQDNQGPSKEVCKYYHKGTCTWGEGCRFLHEDPVPAPLLPRPPIPRTLPPMHGLKPALLNSRPTRDFYPPQPLLPLPGPPVPPPNDVWDRGLRTSNKDRPSKPKPRADYEDGYTDKRVNSNYRDSTYPHSSNYYSSSGSSGSSRHHYSSTSSSSSHLPPSHSSSTSSSHRDPYYRSPSPRRSHYSSSTSSSHHYSSPRDYYEVSDYERRRRQAAEVAPRPDEWEKSDRYGRDIETRYGHSSSTSSSRHKKYTPAAETEYLDKWQPRPAERGSNLSSISSSDSPTHLSRNLTDSDSTGSWSDLSDKGSKEHTKRTNYRTRPSSSSVGPPLNSEAQRMSSTSGMKRIPKLSERNRPRPYTEPCDVAPFEDSHPNSGQVNNDPPRSRLQRDGEKTHEGSVSRSSLSSGSMLDEAPRKNRHGNVYNSSEGFRSRHDSDVNSQKRSFDSETESFKAKKIRNDLDETSSHSSNASPSSSPQPQKEKFVMDFVGKVRSKVNRA